MDSGDPTSDELRAIHATDPAAGTALLQRKYGRELKSFLQMLAPGASISDVISDTWEAVLRGLPSFRFECSPKSWVFSIGRRRPQNARRREPPAAPGPGDAGVG